MDKELVGAFLEDLQSSEETTLEAPSTEMPESKEPSGSEQGKEPETGSTKSEEEGKVSGEGAERVLPDEVKPIVSLLGEELKTLKSKGLEVDVSSFTPEEVHGLLQKGLRFYQAMGELSQEREALSARQKALEDAMRQVEEQSSKINTFGQTGQTKTKEVWQPEVPEFLRVNEDDPPETASLKKFLADLSQQVSSVATLKQEQELKTRQDQLLSEVKKYQETYPLASVEETLAVHFLSGGKIPISKIMETGHKAYGSTDFVKRVFQAHPEVKKAIKDELVAEYLKTKKQATETLPKTAPATAKVPITTTPEAETIDFKNAAEKARQLLKEYLKED